MVSASTAHEGPGQAPTEQDHHSAGLVTLSTTATSAPRGVREITSVALADPSGRRRLRSSAGSTSMPRFLISSRPTSWALTQARRSLTPYGSRSRTLNAVAKGVRTRSVPGEVGEVRVEEVRLQVRAELGDAAGPDHRTVRLVEIGTERADVQRLGATGDHPRVRQDQGRAPPGLGVGAGPQADLDGVPAVGEPFGLGGRRDERRAAARVRASPRRSGCRRAGR